MKIIGVAGNGNFIAEVSRTEIEKVFDKYYGNMPELKLGDVVDLGKGWDFRSNIQASCKAMVDAVKSFDSSQKTLMSFAVMVAQLPAPATEEVA